MRLAKFNASADRIRGRSLQVQDWNAALTRMLALSPDEITGQSFQEFVLPESKPFLDQLADDQNYQHNLHLRSKDGQVRVVHAMIYPFDEGFIIFAERLSIADDEILRRMTRMNNELGNLTRQLTQQKRELEEANSRIKTLRGMLPICAACKKIRDDKGYWQHLEAYLQEHSEAEFSHGICPDCMKELYPEIYARRGNDDDGIDEKQA